MLTAINEKFLGTNRRGLGRRKSTKDRWKGRTRNNKLVFFEDHTREWKGERAHVAITHTGPWSLQGAVALLMSLTIHCDGKLTALVIARSRICDEAISHPSNAWSPSTTTAN